jgi:hypothetical protein
LVWLGPKGGPTAQGEKGVGLCCAPGAPLPLPQPPTAAPCMNAHVHTDGQLLAAVAGRKAVGRGMDLLLGRRQSEATPHPHPNPTPDPQCGGREALPPTT